VAKLTVSLANNPIKITAVHNGNIDSPAYLQNNCNKWASKYVQNVKMEFKKMVDAFI